MKPFTNAQLKCLRGLLARHIEVVSFDEEGNSSSRETSFFESDLLSKLNSMIISNSAPKRHRIEYHPVSRNKYVVEFLGYDDGEDLQAAIETAKNRIADTWKIERDMVEVSIRPHNSSYSIKYGTLMAEAIFRRVLPEPETAGEKARRELLETAAKQSPEKAAAVKAILDSLNF